MKIQIVFIALLTSVLCFPQSSSAQNADKSVFSVTGYPLPRFVSLASGKVYMRSGPGRKYPVLWEYQRKGLPVEIIMEFDIWRKIRDHDGEEGWVHKSLLSGKRTAISIHDDLIEVKRRNDKASRLMAYLEPKAILELDECDEAWCYVRSQGYSGWVEKKYLWGIYENERFD